MHTYVAIHFDKFAYLYVWIVHAWRWMEERINARMVGVLGREKVPAHSAFILPNVRQVYGGLQ